MAPKPALLLTFSISFLLLLQISLSDLPIGVNYGTLANNLPPPSQVASFLKAYTSITHIKLFDANPAILSAFANTNISVTVTVANGDIPSLSKLPAAQSWVSSNISPFLPATKIAQIAVGNEIIATSDKNLIAHLVPAMRSLHAALRLSGMPTVAVTTPHSLGILSLSEPPSAGRFRRGYDQAIFAPMLDFHNRTGTPFMVNPYPYFGFSDKTLNYALFKPNAGIYDPTTRITYTNMFDAQMDAVYSAMKRLGYGNVKISVGETGWPSVGDPDQPAVNMANAISYNGNLIRHVNSGKGTPLMPGRRFETFIFALFNENLKPGSTAERNFGLFQPDLTPVYDVGIMRGKAAGPSATPSVPTPAPSGGGKKWCVAKGGASAQALQANIDYACNNGVDCSPIQAGGACFLPNTVESHAAYVMNAYYQSHGRNDFNCDFSQTGLITTSNPSHSTCQFNA
ncbi:hypothetical protein MRB53_011024 [Persea americana]|uniref:Uncharacterized protein n=1 Tax=Persea americana TaxID=3435 RepID=A0ACC2LTM7_PERAE|nr:hypothetical protein MRB53_011024 [Persea americana]